MKIKIIKNNFNQLEAFTSDDFENIKKIKEGVCYEFELKKVRNPLFHRKFFALLNIGFQNTKLHFPDIDAYRYYIILKAGFYVKIETNKGVLYIPQSISFSKMDEIEFTELYKRTFEQICIDIEADQKTIENELINFM